MRVNKSLAFILLVLCCSFGFAQAPAPTMRVEHDGLQKLGWQMVWPTGTFKEMTVFETIDFLHAQTAHHLELSAGQVLSKETKDVKTGPEMSEAGITALMAKMTALKVDFASYGVVSLNTNEADQRAVFELAKKLKAKNIICETGAEVLPISDKLAQEYGINVAIISWSRLTDAESMSKALEGRSNRVGVCVDLGELKAAGQDPVAFVKKLSGHIFEVRLRDINDQKKDVPIGTGMVDVAAVAKQLKEQGFKGGCCIGYTGGSGQELIRNFGKSVTAFSDIVTKLGQ